MILDAAAILLGLLAWGSHVVVPWRLRHAAPASRAAWCQAAIPLLVAALLLGLLSIAQRPDAAIAGNLASALTGRPLVKVVVLAVFAALSGDLVLTLGGRRLEPFGWQLVAGLGGLGLLATAAAGEVLRIGEGPGGGPLCLAVCVSCRLAFALAAGDGLAPWSTGRPRLGLPAAAAVPVYLLALPAPVLDGLLHRGGAWTAVSATCLFALAPLVPASLRRPALFAGAVLVTLLLAASAEVSAGLVAPVFERF
jgi:hypothetical protein